MQTFYAVPTSPLWLWLIARCCSKSSSSSSSSSRHAFHASCLPPRATFAYLKQLRYKAVLLWLMQIWHTHGIPGEYQLQVRQ